MSKQPAFRQAGEFPRPLQCFKAFYEGPPDVCKLPNVLQSGTVTTDKLFRSPAQALTTSTPNNINMGLYLIGHGQWTPIPI
jgi:hypothetical protein